jgi:protein-disulfide isomerase
MMLRRSRRDTPVRAKEDRCMGSMARGLALATAGLLATALVACEQSKSGGASEPIPGPPASATAGKIAGKSVTVGDIDEWIKDQLFKQATRGNNPTKVFEIRNRALEQMANERALDEKATKLGKDRDAVLKEEVEKRASVSDADVQSYYDEHKDHFRNLPFEKVAPAVKRQLQAQKQVAAMQEFTKNLRDELGFENDLEAPHFDFAAGGPTQGPADAPVTLVEFADYECPFCKASEPVVKQVLARYPTQVKLVFKNFPIDSHPKARPAAEAALCAQEQGKFWEFHNALFEKSPQIGAEQLGPIATDAGLDAAKLDECAKARKSASKIDGDLAEGKKAGVAGTPAFFVNGVSIASGRTLDDFAKVIDAELTRLGKPVPPPLPPTASMPPMMSPMQSPMPPGAAPAAAQAAPSAPPAAPPTANAAAPAPPTQSANTPAPPPAPPAASPPAPKPAPATPPAPQKPH